MRRVFLFLLTGLAVLPALNAQETADSLSYFLPKTAIRLHLLTERTVLPTEEDNAYTNSASCAPAANKTDTIYRLIGIELEETALPDTAKHYVAPTALYPQLSHIVVDDNGILLAVNDLPEQPAGHTPYRTAPRLSTEEPAARDTTELALCFVPEKETVRQVLFRFSKHRGLTGADDPEGMTYCVTLDDLHTQPSLQVAPGAGADTAEVPGLYVNRPGKVRLTLSQGDTELLSQEFYAAQFGQVEPLSGALWSGRNNARLVLHPTTGSIKSLRTETVR